jgi:FkbM family methyltransferase
VPDKIKKKLIVVANLFQKLAGRVPRIEAGLAFGLRFDAGPEAAAYVKGAVEVPVQETLSASLKTGAIFYDVGANVGFFSVLAGRIVGSAGTVYAFEPVPQNASRLENNARLNNLNNVEVIKIALSGRCGQSELLLARHSGGAVLRGAGIPPDFTESIAVETYTMDVFIEKEQLRPPNLVKIDVEGAELDVLKGMSGVLRKYGPKIILEIDDKVQSRCLDKLSACRKFLRDMGYKINILPNSYRDGNWFVRHLFAKYCN